MNLQKLINELNILEHYCKEIMCEERISEIRELTEHGMLTRIVSVRQGLEKEENETLRLV